MIQQELEQRARHNHTGNHLRGRNLLSHLLLPRHLLRRHSPPRNLPGRRQSGMPLVKAIKSQRLSNVQESGDVSTTASCEEESECYPVRFRNLTIEVAEQHHIDRQGVRSAFQRTFFEWGESSQREASIDDGGAFLVFSRFVRVSPPPWKGRPPFGDTTTASCEEVDRTARQLRKYDAVRPRSHI